jgi:hypothetical protein
MSERNEVTREIRDELKNCKSTRKAMVKLSRMVNNKYISSNLKHVYFGKFETIVYSNDKIGHSRGCHFCKKEINNDAFINEFKSSVNSNNIIILRCSKCIWFCICYKCFRKTSHSRLTYKRKLLCYKFLLSQKFPKDVIRLITKKVK